MSSGVILNGGAAESFTTVEGHHHHHVVEPAGYVDPWEPEDLVATVQFLATLDDRQHNIVQQQFQLADHPLPTVPEQTTKPILQDETLLPQPAPLSDEPEPVNSSMSSEDGNHIVSSEDQSVVTRSDENSHPADPLLVAEEHSVSSAAQTPCSTEERSIIRTTNKPAHLKRVSFGSTKGGSMVETLIYESPLTEEEPACSSSSNSSTGWKTSNKLRPLALTNSSTTELPEETDPLLTSSDSGRSSSASKVRVTYFESKRPLTLPSPDASDAEWDEMTTAEALTVQHHQQQHPHFVTRQISTESGVDNPFRPDGDLSREADELVELLKGGRPISEVLKSKEELQKQEEAGQLSGSPTQNRNPSSSPSKDSTDGGRANGNVSDKTSGGKPGAEATGSPGPGGSVEVQRGVVPAASPGEISQVEHVVIKKKSKCQCCVIQ